MRQADRLILNSLITLTRMLLTVGVGLMTVRIAKSALGISDFGLLEAVGATSALLLMITDALNASASRHLAVEVGRGDDLRVRQVFNTTLGLLGAAASAVFVLGLAVGPWVVLLLNIPPDRERAAVSIFLSALVNLCVMVVLTPFRAVLLAHQDIWVTSVSEVATSLLLLGAAIAIMTLPGDRAVNYSILTTAASLLVGLSTAGICMKRYATSRPRLAHFSRSDLRELGTYGGWTFIGSAAWRFYFAGSVIVLNKFFDTRTNFAYGAAQRLAGYQNNLAASVARAAEPAAANIEGRGNRSGLHLLTNLSSKYQALISLFFLVPASLESAVLLRLWLGDVPDYTPNLLRWVLVWTWSSTLATGHHMAVRASGKIRGYTLISAFFCVVGLAIPVGLLIFWRTSPEVVPASALALSIVSTWVIVWYVGRLIELPVSTWVREVLRPVFLVSLVSVPPAVVVHLALPPVALRVLAVAVVHAAVAAPAVWFIGMSGYERRRFTDTLRGRLKRSLPAAKGSGAA